MVNVKNFTEVNVLVTPYFTISDESITLSGSVLNATFKVNQVVNSAEIDYVTLLVSKTSFVDDVSNIARKDFKDQDAGSMTLSMDMTDNSAVSSAKALFARVGVRTVGADQAVYSKVFQLK